MQAIEFKTTIHNGILTSPPQYRPAWEGKIIRVIVLEDNNIAKTVATPPTDHSQINPLKGSVIFENDLISPINVSWDAEQWSF